jgi:predicted acylesterase/phospholipase RssA
MEDLPIVVAARMSLSFPGLICAVPLWRKDPSYNDENKQEREKFRRCLFSDGGLSSNFPIHFFDRLLPTSPTFAISLDAFDARRSENGKRTWLPSTPEGGVNTQLQDFKGLLGFLLRLVDSAKDWQDNLQSVLPGYRERIVHIGLESEEGGLNLVMEKPTIDALVGYGAEAGARLRDDFDFNAHRWRRFLVAMARLEETLDEVKKAYDETDAHADSFAYFLAKYAEPAQYPQKPEVLEVMRERAKLLAELAANWRRAPVREHGDIPKPDANLRITAKP